ncbi:structural constituent of cell wall [Oxalobacteraceae bacterium IMCC9480]|nr:structural constituent of cell wall [Oxalobacteraceae bacterium IMCC9480]
MALPPVRLSTPPSLNSVTLPVNAEASSVLLLVPPCRMAFVMPLRVSVSVLVVVLMTSVPLVSTMLASRVSSRVSVPPPPVMTSAPAPPVNTSAPDVPVSLSSPAPPSSVTALSPLTSTSLDPPEKRLALISLLLLPPVRIARSKPLMVSISPSMFKSALVKVIVLALLVSTSVSMPPPSPPRKVSAPAPPVRMSLPDPPSRISLPEPPIRTSSPEPPLRITACVKAEASIRLLLSLPDSLASWIFVSVEYTTAPTTVCVTATLPPPFSVDVVDKGPTSMPARLPVNVTVHAPVRTDFLTTTSLSPIAANPVSAVRTSNAVASYAIDFDCSPFKPSVNEPPVTVPVNAMVWTELTPCPMSRLVSVSTKRPSVTSTRVLKPPPPLMSSRPPPPVSMSSPAPPIRVSLPRPPIRVAPRAPAVRMSSPSPPSSVTLMVAAPDASSVLALAPPVRMALLMPVSVSLLVPSNSSVSVSVKLTSRDSTSVSMPPPPMMVSVPAPPVSRLSPALPVMRSLKADPMTWSKLLMPAKPLPVPADRSTTIALWYAE